MGKIRNIYRDKFVECKIRWQLFSVLLSTWFDCDEQGTKFVKFGAEIADIVIIPGCCV